MGITVENGEKFGKEFLAAFKSGFADNSHRDKTAKYFAESVECDWSDGFSGAKTHDDLFKQFETTWGLMVSQMVFDPMWIVDTTNNKLVCAGNNTLMIDGKLEGEKNLVTNPLSFTLTLTDDMKVKTWEGRWNNDYKPMLEALGKVAEKLKAK